MINAKTKSRIALSSSADLILHGSRNGWEYWTNIDGKPLNQVKEIARYFNVQ